MIHYNIYVPNFVKKKKYVLIFSKISLVHSFIIHNIRVMCNKGYDYHKRDSKLSFSGIQAQQIIQKGTG